MFLQGKRILIIKLLYIGDVLGVTQVVASIKQEAPLCTVDVLVNQGTELLLKHHPDIRKVWVYNRRLAKKSLISSLSYNFGLAAQLRAERYDIVIALSGNDRSYFLSFVTGAKLRLTHTVCNRLSKLLMNKFVALDSSKLHFIDFDLEHLRILGIKNKPGTITIHIPDSVKSQISSRLSEASINRNSPKVLIHPGARKRVKQWRPERFASVARLLHEQEGANIILIGGPKENKLLEAVEERMGFQAAFKSTSLSLLELGALLGMCQLFIGNDSGPGHIAAAVECPSLTLFGPTFPHIWKPIGSRSDIVFKNLPCCGCRQEEEYCEHLDKSCMDLIRVDEVWEKARKLLWQNAGKKADIDVRKRCH